MAHIPSTIDDDPLPVFGRVRVPRRDSRSITVHPLSLLSILTRRDSGSIHPDGFI